MDKLKNVLIKDHSKKTKAELIDMLKSLQQIITAEEYQKISGIDPSELDDLTKKDILEIVDAFKENYSEDWETEMSKAALGVISRFMGDVVDDRRFGAEDVADADFAGELSNIDFASIIGGPLQACVEAQTSASLATVDFIERVAFKQEYQEPGADRELMMVDFSYEKTETDDDDGDRTVKIVVPFISLLNIPSFRIDVCDIEFNVKLNSVYTKNTNQTGGGRARLGGLFKLIRFGVNVGTKRNTITDVKVEKEYSLTVKVRATNDELPAGLDRVLTSLVQ